MSTHNLSDHEEHEAEKLAKLVVHFDDEHEHEHEQDEKRKQRERAHSMNVSPRSSRHWTKRNLEALSPQAMSHTCGLGSPLALSTGMSRRSSQTFQFGEGRELAWEKELKQKLLDRDPLAVNLHRTLERMTSPRQLTKLKHMVERAQNPEECTFQPRTIALPSMYPQLSNVEQPFLHRQQQWVHNANKRLQYEQTKIRLKQEAECTFAPAINKSHLYLNLNSFNQQQQNSSVQMNTQQQAQQVNIAQSTVSMKKRRLMQQIKEKQDEEFRKHCTFKPKLCAQSARIAKNRKDNRHFKRRYKSMGSVKIHCDDDEMKECTFRPEINADAPLRLKHVQEYVKEDAYVRLSTTLGLKEASQAEATQSECVNMSKAERESAQKDFFTRMELAQETRRHQLRQLKKKTDPSFRPQINRRSQALVNRSGLNFEDRQRLCLEHQGQSLKQHRLQQSVDREESELRFTPELNEKSRSLVENKKIPRNGPGYSRANYYFFIKHKQEEQRALCGDSTQENERLLSQPRLQKYLAQDVVGRLSDVKAQKEILYSRHKEKEEDECGATDAEMRQSVSDRRLSEIELEDFIERQKQYEMFRKKRIQKLWKRFNDDKDSESELETASPNKKEEEAKKDEEEIGLSYTQLFHEKKQGKDGHGHGHSASGKGNMSYSNLSRMSSKMHCETQFVSM